MKQIKIYNSSKFVEFKFGHAYQEISNKICGIKNFILVDNERFIAPITFSEHDEVFAYRFGKIYQININTETIQKIEISDQGLCYGKLAGEVSMFKKYIGKPLDVIFKINIIKLELSWLQKFIKIISDHLQSREYAGEKIITNAVIKQLLAKTLVNYELAKQYVEAAVLTELCGNSWLAINLASQKIILVVKMLTQLAGGRAILKYSTLTMLDTFQAFHSVYFYGYCNE